MSWLILGASFFGLGWHCLQSCGYLGAYPAALSMHATSGMSLGDAMARLEEPEELASILSAHQGIADAEARVKQLVADRARFIQEAMTAGVSAQQIADALNVDRSRIYRMAKHNYADRRRIK